MSLSVFPVSRILKWTLGLLCLAGVGVILIPTRTVDPLPPAPLSFSWSSVIDLPQAERELTTTLAELIAAQSVNPPGHELRAATVVERILTSEGIPFERHTLSSDRVNLYARLSAKGPESTGENSKRGALCLLSHLDVVPANPSHWRHDPFSGEIHDGALWGRGALDMKGVTALHLSTLLWLHRTKAPLTRDVVLVLVADEEVSNLGMRAFIDQKWSEYGCAHVLNEGAFGVRGLVFPEQDVFPISVAEKGVLWLKVTAQGKAGHGSVPREHFAPTRLFRALESLQADPLPPEVSDPLLDFFALIGAERGGLLGFILRRPFLLKRFALEQIMRADEPRAAVTHTVHLTGLNTGDHRPNVVPAQATALLDVRVLPGVAPESIILQLRQRLRDHPHVSLEVISAQRSPFSEWRGDPVFESIVRQTRFFFPHTVVGPVSSVGFTDSTFAREKGARAYGWVPFLLTKPQLASLHGEDEHVTLEQLNLALKLMLSVVFEVSTAPRPR